MKKSVVIFAAVLAFLLLILVLGYHVFAHINGNIVIGNSIAVIGAANGPTSVVVASKINPFAWLRLALIFLGILTVVFIATKRRK